MEKTNKKLKKTPLFEEHISLEATMVDFGGWDMPVQYKGILSEHKHTREHVSIFDISHMGEFIIEGNVVEDLEYLLTMDIANLPVNSCRYGAMLNDAAGIIDDLIVFRLAEEKWFLVVNSATTETDAQHIKRHLGSGAKFSDVSLTLGKIDVQGPESRDLMKNYVPDIDKLNYYTFDYFNLLGQNVLISRTGYTGELGYEIYYPWEHTCNLWKELMKNNSVKPAGLGARDILRLEMGYSLYGHELAEDITPFESGLNRFVNLDKDFIGKQQLQCHVASGVQRKIVGIISDSRKSPRAGQRMFSLSGDEIGVVTSGTFSPCLGKGIGLGFIAVDQTEKGLEVLFGDSKKNAKGIVSGRVFYKQGTLKN